MTRYLLGSLTRIAPLSERPFEVEAVSRADWREGDYVVGEVSGDSPSYILEWPDGRVGELVRGDLVVGALGSRFATLSLVGDWKDIGEDGAMDSLTPAGVFGRCTSMAAFSYPPTPLVYRGHVKLGGEVTRMADWVSPPRSRRFDLPVIQVIGTSMECGKTTAAKAVIRRLAQRGLRVAGIKLTGVGRYRDILGMQDAGASSILDFVDAGLPSTLTDPDSFVEAVDTMLLKVADEPVDIVVAEAGASPMEPYNGEVAIKRIAPHVGLTMLAASDLYAALGAIDHLGVKPDVIVGRVASTTAGVDIVQDVTGLPAVNPLSSDSLKPLDDLLSRFF
jgi:hypothetical protein